MLLFILGGMWELVRMQRAIFSSYEFINDYAAVIPKGQKERENTAITLSMNPIGQYHGIHVPQ